MIMNAKKMNRRDFITSTGALVGGGLLMGSGFAFAGSRPGAPVPPMRIITATATMDPVRPEAARACARAFAAIGWKVVPDPIDYNQNVQKVLLDHDYDMWLVMLAGTTLRIDPDIFIYQCHHSSLYRKGGYNWTGISDTEIDRLAEAQRKTMDIEKRREIVHRVQQRIHELQAQNVVAYPLMTNAYRADRIRNLTPMMGEGIGGFWSDLSMEVIAGDGYVRTGITNPLKSLNPVGAMGYDEFMALGMIYDRLFRIGTDGIPRPWAAESYTVVNSTTLDVTLRKGMLWHDGRPVTPEDVIFTFNYLARWKAPFHAKNLENIEKVRITSGNGIRFKLREPFAPFISNVLGAVFLIPEHVWRDIPDKVANLDDPLNFPNERPVGSGPFRFEHWDQGRELKVGAFRNHFHPPRCAGIIRVVYGSHDALAAAIEKNECDRTCYALKPGILDDLKKVPNVTARGYPSHGFYSLGYHTRRPPLNDPSFRRALAHLIPKGLIIKALLSGYAGRGGSVIGPTNSLWHNAAIEPFQEDPGKAREVLAKAGYSWDRKGRLLYPGA
jgi:peptide/nickel transport system substrate-binding protein